MVKKTLSARVQECPDWDLRLDRDAKAAVTNLQSARTERSGANADGWVMPGPRSSPLWRGESSLASALEE